MKTYFGMKDFEGHGQVTVQGPGGEVRALCDDDKIEWSWGPDSGGTLACHLLINAGFSTAGYNALYKKLVKLDPDASWTIDWYELKGFADAADVAKTKGDGDA